MGKIAVHDLSLVDAFLRQKGTVLSSSARVLDMLSEFAEFSKEMRQGEDYARLSEEMGDFYYSLLAYCVENSLEPRAIDLLARSEAELLACAEESLGKLAKAVLRNTQYGRLIDARPGSEEVQDVINALLASVLQLAAGLKIGTTSALSAALLKYEQRLAETATMDSGK